MSISESSQRNLPAQWPMPSESALLAAVAVGLSIFHILVATILMPASAKAPLIPEQEVLSRLCD